MKSSVESRGVSSCGKQFLLLVEIITKVWCYLLERASDSTYDIVICNILQEFSIDTFTALDLSATSDISAGIMEFQSRVLKNVLVCAFCSASRLD